MTHQEMQELIEHYREQNKVLFYGLDKAVDRLNDMVNALHTYTVAEFMKLGREAILEEEDA